MCCAELPNGSSCTTGAGCISTICRNGLCAGKALGELCTVNGMCRSRICTAIGAERRCTKKVAGALCTNNNECASASCIARTCECSPACTSLTCAQGCTLPATCIDVPLPFADYCGVVKDVGGACVGDFECLSGICNVGFCSLKLAGDVCTEGPECASGRCVDGVCECSTTCEYDPASCAEGCVLPDTCFVIPAPYANYCGEQRENGEACLVSAECLSGVCTEGVCSLKVAGDVCTGGPECASGSCVDGVCECSTTCVFDPASCAQGCSAPETCIELGLYTDYCGEKKENGEACRGRNECLSGNCKEGFCSLMSNGAMCDEDAQCASGSCYAGVCQCSPLCVYDPASCAAGCPLPETCIVLPAPWADYCGVRKARGGSCRDGRECLSGVCSNGICILKTAGAPCTRSSECASNSCYSGVCQCSPACVYNAASCAQGCALPTTCIVLPAKFANYCGVKRGNGATCRGANECQSGICSQGLCAVP